MVKKESSISEAMMYERGRQSVGRVMAVLEQRPWIYKIAETEVRGEKDEAGVDLVAVLDHGVLTGTMGIQVKSSSWGIDNFLRVGRYIAEKKEISLREFWVDTELLVLANGFWSEMVINGAVMYQMRWLMGLKGERGEKFFLDLMKDDVDGVFCYQTQKEVVEEVCPWVLDWR